MIITASRVILYPFRFLWYKAGLRTWWLGDHWIIGKIAEFKGNWVNLDDCRYDISNPAISTSLKCRFLLNRYEKEEREAIAEYLDPETAAIELGGCIGVLSCLINKRLNDPSKQIVVEANPALIPSLEKNRSINNCHFEIINAAVGYSGSTVRFHLHDKFVGGSVERETGKSIEVRSVTLRDLVKKSGSAVSTLMCDIEGSEIELIEKELDVLAEHISLFIVEFHPAISTKEKIDLAHNRLDQAGFELIYDKRHVRTYRNKNIKTASNASKY